MQVVHLLPGELLYDYVSTTRVEPIAPKECAAAATLAQEDEEGERWQLLGEDGRCQEDKV